MGTATVYADAHISGAFSNPNNAIGNTPTTWAGDVNVNSNYTSRWSLADLVSALTPGAVQTINVLARKGSNSGTPTIALNLYENGSLVSQILSATGITSTTGQTLSATFNTSVITNPNNVEIEVAQTSAGGSPSARNSAQIAYIQWVANVDTDPKHVSGGGGGSLVISGAGSGIAAKYHAASGGSGGAVTISGSGSGTKRVVGSGSGTAITVSGSGSGGIYRRVSGSGGGTVTITGAASGIKNVSGSASGSVVISGSGAGAGKSPLMFLTKNIKRNGVVVKATVYKKINGSLVQTGGQTR